MRTLVDLLRNTEARRQMDHFIEQVLGLRYSGTDHQGRGSSALMRSSDTLQSYKSKIQIVPVLASWFDTFGFPVAHAVLRSCNNLHVFIFFLHHVQILRVRPNARSVGVSTPELLDAARLFRIALRPLALPPQVKETHSARILPNVLLTRPDGQTAHICAVSGKTACVTSARHIPLLFVRARLKRMLAPRKSSTEEYPSVREACDTFWQGSVPSVPKHQVAGRFHRN